jgi:hypothetical protein
VGAPAIAQVVAFIFKPAGIVGEMVQLVGVPPEMVGVRVLMLVFKTRESGVVA